MSIVLLLVLMARVLYFVGDGVNDGSGGGGGSNSSGSDFAEAG